MARHLDAVDQKIITVLSQDSRTSMRTLSEMVHISRANAYSRVQRLVEDGVIRRFTLEVDPVARGFGTTAFVTLNMHQANWRKTREHISGLPGVVHIALVGGEFDVILLVRAKDNQDLRRLVFDEIQSIPGVISSRTLLVFDEQTMAW